MLETVRQLTFVVVIGRSFRKTVVRVYEEGDVPASGFTKIQSATRSSWRRGKHEKEN